ncbi:23S rRNA (adenine(2503)-C(2))-methyltransferase RlmN [Ornithobacterium rhinotracheale]|uniref:Probable dual-specificity RNA methyltransferase RlmN n=1 Tax=Ornithobacterium rhinotracheale (strain ATCC 51463 / DSM 15997 / CCUG 23171 / CIP 104009 / LMG 9086) TaxID=867902 RepID=I3ZXE6_ORNRL|nr:23S rRNA (adenine(2503)-C(2))-methyltransferase RlmN [Ornithobacterium rhinotracheale]AFL96380.1 23S rRNA m(2)A-2503 methyltransferase [Ornithobacterium rhinotracheale DSM 15997]AIP98608.1 50S rRNA methyltransferase [Ornithobacterium rhinotracheale ORT-UMN 88]KGB67612.1 50S rRNA methyltransferase [Ornithobacterium rhinotracheale H06-030791]MCK0194709.1 23S rRNA (adenine(2503)-C(2))-methyltransferase RlmN [Ornithobacterium rhinotracheale]MCK0201075.1 23S rRNA (adenine(2503)-C(2))-methyltrans
MSQSKKDIRKLSLQEIQDFIVSHGEKAFRAKQIYEWLWNKNAHTFEQMSSLSKELRSLLDEHFVIQPIRVEEHQKSEDGTIKNAIKLFDNNVVESVLIPTEKRTTACVSSQVGCSLDCNFCATAKLMRMRNLNVAEIVDQVALIDQQSRENYGIPLSNIVYMGMGEPLLNYNNVVDSIRKITTPFPNGLGMSPRRITVSTSGIPKMIKKLADENLKVGLALSLHSAIEEKRNQIMPFSHKFPLTEILESLQYWYDKTKSRITLEYIIWKNVNDTPEDVKALVKFCKKVPTKVNLIEYNSIGDDKFAQAPEDVTNMYIQALENENIIVNVRRSRGKDIDAACGQLANKNKIAQNL